MAVPGQFITVLKPRTYIAPRETKLPAQDLAYDGVWPTGWIKLRNTANGVQMTPVNPHQDVPSDENGIIATLPSGADTINMTWQSRTPEENLLKWISGFAKRTVAAVAQRETLTFSGANIATAGSVRIVLGGVAYLVSVALGDTPIAVADKVRAATFGTGDSGWVAGGTAGTAVVVFTSNSTGRKTPAPSFDANGTGATGAFAVPATQTGMLAFDELYLDPSEPNEFMVGIEGEAPAGTLRATKTKIRIFAYNVQQTDNPQLHARTTGSDGLLQPVATVRCLPGDILPSQLEDTGILQVDPKGRFSWMMI